MVVESTLPSAFGEKPLKGGVMSGKYASKRECLWRVRMNKFANEFSTDYARSQRVLAIVFDKFKSRKELEGEWGDKHVPMFSRKLEKLDPQILPPKVPLNIISEYAVTYVVLPSSTKNDMDVTRFDNGDALPSHSPSRDHFTSQGVWLVSERLKTLMDQGKHGDMFNTVESMDKNDLQKHIYPMMTTLDHFECLYGC